MGFWTTMAAAGTAMQTAGTYMQGKAEADAQKADARLADYNAAVEEQNARIVEAKSRFDQLRQLRQASATMGSLRARLGASGALLTEGAPARLTAEQAFELELENAMIGESGMTAASQRRSQAAAYRTSAAYARARAKQYKKAGIINTATSLLSGVGAMKQAGMLEGLGKKKPPKSLTNVGSGDLTSLGGVSYKF